MNLYRLLRKRQEERRPLRIAMIGAGKFGTMFLAQARTTPGIHLVAVVDLSPKRAIDALARVGWPAEQISAPDLDDATRTGRTHVSSDVDALMRHGGIEIVVEATGDPMAATTHILTAFANGKHVVNVTVEADALCGPLLARRAEKEGMIYSLAYGDQPALICDLVDWARAAGLDVVSAGRGHKWLPHYAASTPETVWQHYGLTEEQAKAGGMNPQMFNSFLDGSKPAIECTAVCNATGLLPPPDGLEFPPASLTEIPYVCRPKSDGGQLHFKGQVEVLSSLERDGRPIVDNLRWGVFVAFAAGNDYVRRCFSEYGLITDPSGRYGAMYKRWHLIGLELSVSVASVGLRSEPTGRPDDFRADTVAVAKRDLVPGEILDGEGGFTVVGKLVSASTSLANGALPLGLANKVAVVNQVKAGSVLRWIDVKVDATREAVRARRDMEVMFGAGLARPAS